MKKISPPFQNSWKLSWLYEKKVQLDNLQWEELIKPLLKKETIQDFFGQNQNVQFWDTKYSKIWYYLFNFSPKLYGESSGEHHCAIFAKTSSSLKRPNCVHRVFYTNPSSSSTSFLQNKPSVFFVGDILDFAWQRLNHESRQTFHLTFLVLLSGLVHFKLMKQYIPK